MNIAGTNAQSSAAARDIRAKLVADAESSNPLHVAVESDSDSSRAGLDSLLVNWSRAWQLKLDENKSFWKKDPRFVFRYNSDAPSIAYDPETIPRRQLGSFTLFHYPYVHERSTQSVTREEIATGVNRGGDFTRDMHGTLMDDPFNPSETVVRANRWPGALFHSLLVSRDKKPQIETRKFLASELQWAARGAVVQFHRQKNIFNHHHAHLFHPSSVPISNFRNAFEPSSRWGDVVCGTLKGYPLAHIGISSAQSSHLLRPTMVMHQMLDAKGRFFDHVILKDDDGKLIVLFFLLSGHPFRGNCNPVGLLRSDRFDVSEDEMGANLTEMLVPQSTQDAVWNECEEFFGRRLFHAN